jgi:soluble lytic murein transglycosylase-like protein
VVSCGWGRAVAAVKGLVAASAFLWSASAFAAADLIDHWAAEIAEASSRFAIPEAWIRRVMQIESGGKTLLGGEPIVSRAGAMGLMQLMPGTWREMRSLLGLGPDPHDPADNILAGAAYLRLMYDRFGYPGLFAAYNAGPARYSAYLSGRRSLPAETRAYVATAARAGRGPPDLPRLASTAVFALAKARSPRVAVADPLSPSGDGLFVPLGRPTDR